MWLPICASDYWCAVRKACMRIRGCIRCSIRYDDVWWKHDEDKRDGQTSLFERLIKKSSLCWKRDAVRLRVNRYLSRRVARYTIGNNGPFRLILLPSLSLHPSSSKLRRSRLARDSCAPIICMRKHGQKRAQKQRIACLSLWRITQSSTEAARTENEIASRMSRQVMRSRVIIAASSLHAVTSDSDDGDFIFHENGN